ncbi:hypothetical protein ACPCBF_24625 [Streptomyces pseudogriseolus]|uniref:hypothetical protein n=1 Tax=Streptomyces pseudogriseolus TaxID=36817 RepID=UPI003FA2338A
MTGPRPDSRLAHLVTQELAPRIGAWHLAQLLGDEVARSAAVRAEVDRIGRAHATGQPCGDPHCTHTTCWRAHLTTLTIDKGDHPCTTTPHDEVSPTRSRSAAPDA